MARTGAVLRRLGVGPVRGKEDALRGMLLLYLADWKGALDLDRPLSDADWQIASWGPFSSKALSCLRRSDAFISSLGSPSDMLSADEERIVANLRERLGGKPTSELMRLVQSTFPVLVDGAQAGRPTGLDLRELAHRYKKDFSREREKVVA